MWEEQKAWLERGISLGVRSDDAKLVLYYTKAIKAMKSSERVERSMNDER